MKVATVENDFQDVEDHSRRKSKRGSSDIKIGEYELYKLLRPVIQSMKCFGLCALDRKRLSSNPQSKFYLCYSVFSLLLVNLFFFLQMSNIRGFGTTDDWVWSVSFLAWTWCVIFQGIVIFWMCSIKNAWQVVFALYENTKQGILKCPKYMAVKQRIYMYVLLGWIVLFFMSSITIYVLVLSGGHPALLCVRGLCTVYFTATWITPIIFLISLTDIIASHFNHFNVKVVEMSKTSPSQFYESIKSVRGLHLMLERVVAGSDSVLGKIAGLTVFSNLVAICCTVYLLAYSRDFLEESTALYILLIYIIILVLVLFGMMGMCARLKEEVSAYQQLGRNILSKEHNKKNVF